MTPPLSKDRVRRKLGNREEALEMIRLWQSRETIPSCAQFSIIEGEEEFIPPSVRKPPRELGMGDKGGEFFGSQNQP